GRRFRFRFFFSSRRGHTRFSSDWSSDVCSSDLFWYHLSGVEPWTHPSGKWYKKALLKAARRHGLDPDTPWEQLSEPGRRLVYEGDDGFPGINGFFEEVESYRYKLHVRVFLSRYRSQSRCPICAGARLTAVALAVRVAGLTIAQFSALTIEEAARTLADLKLTAWETVVAREILRQLT